jgi:capsular polysaccharide biosynthesis protein
MIKQYDIISLADAAHRGIVGRDGRPIVTRHDFLSSTTLDVPALGYGHRELCGIHSNQQPNDPQNQLQFQIPRADRYRIRNAIVHFAYGITTAEDYIFSDTLYHAPLHAIPGAGHLENGKFLLPIKVPDGRLNRAYHLLAGNLDNYFHWLVDVVSRIDVNLFTSGHMGNASEARPILLTPDRNAPYQTDSLRLLVNHHIPILACADNGVFKVEDLIYSPNLSGNGWYPHPQITQAFNEIVRLVHKYSDWNKISSCSSKFLDGPRKIYISRKDSANRKLVNEDEIERIVAKAGFECILLSELSFFEQVHLFSRATHIIAPHGAGLTNILFCQPGTALCELHMDAYVQWAFRRLAGTRKMRYGCIVGTANESWNDWAHLNTWTLPLDVLHQVLSDRSFTIDLSYANK